MKPSKALRNFAQEIAVGPDQADDSPPVRDGMGHLSQPQHNAVGGRAGPCEFLACKGPTEDVLEEHLGEKG